MLFIFSKLFNFFTSPINWILGLLVISLLLKNRKAKQVLWGLNAFLLVVFTNNSLYVRAVNAWSAPYIQANDTGRIYELAMVAGGSTDYSPDLQQIDYNEQGDRLTEAIRLYRLGKIRKLYLSGESAFNVIQGITYAPQFLAYMQQMGVDSSDIILEQHARTTQENVDNLKKLLPANTNKTPILLITSGWHMRRILKGFNGSGLNLVPYAVDVPGRSSRMEWQDYLPSWKAAQNWQKLIHELAGLVLI